MCRGVQGVCRVYRVFRECVGVYKERVEYRECVTRLYRDCVWGVRICVVVYRECYRVIRGVCYREVQDFV